MRRTEPIDIAIIVRDRPSMFRACLAALYRHTAVPFRITAVVGGATAAVRAELAAWPDLHAITRAQPLSQAESRRLALGAIASSRCVLMENDAIVHSGWLEPLLATADRERAAVVVPLLYWHRGVHAAGCELDIVGDRVVHRIEYRDLRPRPVGYPETHLILVDLAQVEPHALCDDVEPLDVDLGLTLRVRRRIAMFEPRSIVTYAAPPAMDVGDIPHTLDRWSLVRYRACHARFEAKWNLRYDAAAKLTSYRRQAARLALVRRVPHAGAVALTNLATGVANSLTTIATSGRSYRAFG